MAYWWEEMATHRSFEEKQGPKLGLQLGSGLTRLQRWSLGEGGVEAGLAEAEKPVATAISGVKRVGRPRVEGVRPWEAEGKSRSAWFRDRVRKDREEG